MVCSPSIFIAESSWSEIGVTPNTLWLSPIVCPPRHKERLDLLVDSCPEDVLGRFAEGVSPVGDLAFVCRFTAFSDSLSTIPANNFTTLACVLASVLAQVKQLTSENLGSLFRSCPNELARSANTKLSAPEKPTKSLLNTSLKRDTLGIFAVPRHFTFFLAKPATRRRMDWQFACRRKRRIERHQKHKETVKTRQLAI